MLMSLFVVSLSVNATALASIIMLLIALTQCVSRCKQKRPVHDGDKHLKQLDSATGRIENSVPTLLKKGDCLQTKNASNRTPAPSFDVSGTPSQQSSPQEQKTQQTNPDEGNGKIEKIEKDSQFHEIEKEVSLSQRDNERNETVHNGTNKNNKSINKDVVFGGTTLNGCKINDMMVEEEKDEEEMKREIIGPTKLIDRSSVQRTKEAKIKVIPTAEGHDLKLQNTQKTEDEEAIKAGESESAAEPIPEPLSDARTQLSKTIVIKPDDDTIEHVESLKESHSEDG